MGDTIDLLLKNGLVYDGSGDAPFRGNVGIKGDRIVLSGSETAESEVVIDIDGLCVSPGFVDTHGHSEFNMIAAPECESKVLQGVTTEINGNCGLSAGPLLNDAKIRREADFVEAGIPYRWNSLKEYFVYLNERYPVINYGTLSGQGNIRASVMGYDRREPDSVELEQMRTLLMNDIIEGSLGCSTGLIYPPGVFTETNELVELLKNIGINGQLIYATHMRSEGDRLIESIQEAIRVGWEANWNVHISHLKTGGKRNWPKIDEAIETIENSSRKGIRITFDRYPYTASATDLDTVLPSWMYEGGNEAECERLRTSSVRRILVDYLREQYGANDLYRSIMISTVTLEKNHWMEGKTVDEIAHVINRNPEEVILDLLLEEKVRVGAIFETMNEDNLRRFLSHPLCMVGSDSAVRNFKGVTAIGKPHPRAFGTFPRYLGKYIIEEGLLSLEEAIRRITSFAAETFGIVDRGRIRAGFFADLVIFDPMSVRDNATYQEPFMKPDGIHHVIINGKVAVMAGEAVRGIRSGRILKREGRM
ncbi:MAG: hypothetical protein BV458_13275 [Thermoplasmata archaeon M9B2D]|nr:MAG: hypothetical protein BV458_13275 [Thermoplasmata archaeon M9B2D]